MSLDLIRFHLLRNTQYIYLQLASPLTLALIACFVHHYPLATTGGEETKISGKINMNAFLHKNGNHQEIVYRWEHDLCKTYFFTSIIYHIHVLGM
jgi:hypothetical protein